jgi:hypothetical protein
MNCKCISRVKREKGGGGGLLLGCFLMIGVDRAQV